MIVREFHITEVISVVSARMVAVSGMDGILALLDFMCGSPVHTPQIPAAIRICRPLLFHQFPWLANELAVGVTSESLPAWAAAMEERHGRTVCVQHVPATADFLGDLITELQPIRGPARH